MSRPRRGYSDEEIDAVVLADQLRRADALDRERQADPAWTLAEDDSGLPGLVWVRVEG